MHLTRTLLFVGILNLLAFPAAEASEVWVASECEIGSPACGGAFDAIFRYDQGGNLISLFGPEVGGRVSAMTLVGQEVWVGTNGGSLVDRYDLNGSYISSADTSLFGEGVFAMATVAEPGTALLVGIGLTILSGRSRQRADFPVRLAAEDSTNL